MALYPPYTNVIIIIIFYFYFFNAHWHKAAGGDIEAKQSKWLQRHLLLLSCIG